MYKYLLAFLLFFSVSVFADTGGVYTTDIKSFADYPTAAKCAGAAGDSEVQLVDEASDFSTINTAGIYYYCVEPGSYTADLDITKVCTSGQRCYIWHYDTTETHEAHPVNMTEAQRSIIAGHIYFLSGAEYWVVDRITLADDTDATVRMQPSAGHNSIVSRMLIEDSLGAHVAPGGDNNLVQNSVIRNSAGQVGFDDIAILFYGEDFKVVGNEFYDIRGDTLQVSNGAEGGLIANNEFYVTSAMYTDCSHNFTVTGACMCVENGLDFKGGALNTDGFPFTINEQLLVKGNTLWGFNRDDDSSANNTCGTGAGSLGLAFVIHGGTQGEDGQAGEGVRFEDNVIWSGENNIDSLGIIGANDINRHYSFINNLMYDLNHTFSLPPSKTDKHELYYNTFINTGMDTVNGAMIGNTDYIDWLCNVFMNVNNNGLSAVGSNELWDYNAYYNHDNSFTTNTNDYVSTNDSESKNEMYCWPRYKYTNLTAQCVPLASTTVESPHGDMCSGATQTATRGVDDLAQLTRVRAGFVAPYLERTMEYEEGQPMTVNGLVTRSFNFVAPVKDNYQFYFNATTTDGDDDSLSYNVDSRGNNIISFASPSTEWRKAKVNINLDAGLHTLTVIERETGIVIDKMLVTNNPNFVSP